MSRWMRTTVCLRPFRKAGPRIEREQLGDKAVVHCYGHGGAGWSLAWGTAEAAAELAVTDSPESVAVIGAGCIGLAVANVLQRAGVPTRIYAQDFPADTRSSRATGAWSPDSRIAMTAEAGAGFPDTWEKWARRSYAVHQQYVGLAGDPVEFTPRYAVREPQSDGERGDEEFAKLESRIRDLMAPWSTLDSEAHPFPTENTVRHGQAMTFNIAEYTQRLVHDFYMMGGAMKHAVFTQPQEVLALSEPVIINCTGFGARALWGDDSVIPVRGQIGWFSAQPDRLYGLYHKGVYTLSRRDGIAVQALGSNDYFGFDIDHERPDRDELASALETLQPMFNWA